MGENFPTMRSIERILLLLLLIIISILITVNILNDTTSRNVTGGSNSTENIYGGSRRKKHKNRGKSNKINGNAFNGDVVKDLKLNPASKFETYVRERMEKITGVKFPTVYPAWLRYKGKQLELDGYNADYKLAFETQGPQHTRFSSKDDPRYIKYLNRIENDEAKIRICENNNVGLIIIDYKVPKHLIGSYIRSRIYDISEQWKDRGLYDQVEKLGTLACRTGDYVGVITNKPVVGFDS